MDDHERLERLDRLEARLDGVEFELRNLIRAIDLARARDPAGFAERIGAGDVASKAEPTAEPTPESASPPPSERPPDLSTPARPLPDYRASRTKPRPSAQDRGFEAWFGENALLVVGVLALVAAVGFALKYAFDQGWVSPALRVLAGLAFGIGLASYGERQQRRGLRKFGAAAVGAGAAIAYLAAWAAAGPYGFVGSLTGVIVLAVISGFVLLSALRSGEEYLAAIAATGAYLAPFLLGDAAMSADLLLGYAALVSGAIGLAAGRRGWRMTMGLVLVGFFGLAWAAHGRADAAWFALYLTAAGGAALAGLRTLGWSAHELLARAAAWLGLLAGALHVDTGAWQAWAYAVLPALLVLPGWIEAAHPGGGAPAGRAGTNDPDGGRRRLLSRTMLVASALAWSFVLLVALPETLTAVPLALVLPLAVLYVAPAVLRGSPELLTAGLGVAAMGVAAQWDGTDLTLGWAVLVVAAGYLAGREPLSASRWAAVLLGFFAVQRFLTLDLFERAASDPAFVGAWSWTMYVLVAALVLLAVNGWNEGNRRIADQRGFDLRVITWLLAGALALAGGTIEIDRFFAQRMGAGTDVAVLTSGLSVSAYWLLFAAGLLAFGFRTNRRAVRITGLVVAALAIGKVALYDLARLEALYRVASFALLAVIALVGANAYHRRARAEELTEGAD